MSSVEERVVLMDNGSLRPEAVMALRRLAGEVGRLLGREVDAVSLLHSSKIDPEVLGGVKAEVMVPYLRRLKREGIARVRVLPMFFGPSAALSEYLPGRLVELEGQVPEVAIGDVLVCGDELDRELARLMAEEVRRVISDRDLEKPSVVMVDHGTPKIEVNAVRERMGDLVREELGEGISELTTSSMERRDGSEYDFNEPLLERVLSGLDGDVVVSLLFAGPGRHAGEGGDVAQICNEAIARCGGLEVYRTRVLSDEVSGLAEMIVKRSGM